MLSLSNLFHTGFTVDDLEAAMAEIGTDLGVTWTAIEERTMNLRGPNGPFRPRMRFVYSTSGPHRIELLQAVPGTIWEAQAPGSYGVVTAHHLGIWCDDIPGTSAALIESGAPLLATYDSDPALAVGFAYHRLQSGVIVELVDSSRRTGFESWFAGGPFPVGG